eukprot:m.146872 g.146872  ORF g.146872 m.146872 type:complete len:869 (+) comp16817_c0_seq1:136-2742(+)
MARHIASLLEWVKLFENVSGARNTPEDLSDGVALAEIMAQIAPKFMTADKLSKLKRDAGANAVIKASNIKKLKRTLLDFYADELKVEEANISIPSDQDVASGQLEAVSKMMELVLGCAVQCATKETYITQLMQLDDDVQQDLMSSIQQMISLTHDSARASTGDASGGNDEAVRKALIEKEEAAHSLRQLKREYDRLVEQYDQAQEDVAEARAELAKAKDQLTQFMNDSSGDHEQTIHQLKTQLEDANASLAHEREENAENLKQSERKQADLLRQLDAANADAQAARRLREELEDVRLIADKVPQLEGRIEQYQRKFEEQSSLKQQVKSLEEGQRALQKKVEEESRRANFCQTQVDQYKQQAKELDAKCFEEAKRADGLEFKFKRAQDDVTRLTAEKERLVNERRELSKEINDIKLGKLSESGSVGGEVLSPDMHARLLALEQENAALRVQASGSVEEQIVQLKAMLEDAAQRKQQLEAENRELHLKAMTLEARSTSGPVKSTNEVAYEEMAAAERALNNAKAKLTALEATHTVTVEKLKLTEEELSRAQKELIDLRKQHSMVGLDQKQLVEQLSQKYQEEAEAKITEEVSRYKSMNEQLVGDATSAKNELQSLAARHRELEGRHTVAVQERDEARAAVSAKNEEISTLLREKTSMQNELLSTVKKHSEDMSEAEKRFRKEMDAMTERLRKDMSSQSSGGSNEVMQLKLDLANLEKSHLADMREADRKHSEAVAAKTAELLLAEKQIQALKEQIKTLESKISKQTDDLESLRTQLTQRPDAVDNQEAITALQNQLKEMTGKHAFEVQSRERMKTQHEREMRLMVSAWYDMGTQYQRLAVKDPERSTSFKGQSFLARQRNATIHKHGQTE